MKIYGYNLMYIVDWVTPWLLKSGYSTSPFLFVVQILFLLKFSASIGCSGRRCDRQRTNNYDGSAILAVNMKKKEYSDHIDHRAAMMEPN